MSLFSHPMLFSDDFRFKRAQEHQALKQQGNQATKDAKSLDSGSSPFQ